MEATHVLPEFRQILVVQERIAYVQAGLAVLETQLHAARGLAFGAFVDGGSGLRQVEADMDLFICSLRRWFAEMISAASQYVADAVKLHGVRSHDEALAENAEREAQNREGEDR